MYVIYYEFIDLNIGIQQSHIIKTPGYLQLYWLDNRGIESRLIKKSTLG